MEQEVKLLKLVVPLANFGRMKIYTSFTPSREVSCRARAVQDVGRDEAWRVSRDVEYAGIKGELVKRPVRE